MLSDDSGQSFITSYLFYCRMSHTSVVHTLDVCDVTMTMFHHGLLSGPGGVRKSGFV